MKNVSCQQYDIYERLAMHKTLLKIRLKTENGIEELEGILVDFKVIDGVEHGFLKTGRCFPLIDILHFEEI